MSTQPMRPAEMLMLAVLSLLWGGSFIFISLAVQDLPAFTIVAARVTTAGLILLIVVRLSGYNLPTDWHAWRDFMVMALLGNAIPFSLITWGQNFVPSGLAAILNATTPLFGVLFLRLVDGGSIGALRGAGLLAGLAGVTILVGPKAFDGAIPGLIGAGAILLAACSYGASGPWARRFRDTPTVVTATCTMLAASVQTIPMALIVDQPWTLQPGIVAVAAVLALASISTALAYLLFFRLMERAGPANTLLVTFLVPVSAILLGALFLGERLPWNAFAGMALIFTGLGAIDGRPVQWLRRKLTGAPAPASSPTSP